MRTLEPFLKKFMVMSLLVMYLLIALTYILYLPKYNPLRAASNHSRIHTRAALNPTHHVEHGIGNIVVMVHRAFRSTIENKQDALISFSQVALVLTSFIGMIMFIDLLARSGRDLKIYRNSCQYAYLSYCSLRI